MRLGDALWLRILDLERALSARSYAADGNLVLELTDAFRPENAGTWRIDVTDSRAEVIRADGAAADLRLDVADLASAYLGGFSFARLARAGRMEALAEGAVERSDALFHTVVAPWCPEVF
jgi:predicted acetyltransferase